MASSRFDELTKALATSTSRRQALQRIGGTLVGSVLAAWPFTQALAAGGGNSGAAHFCAAVFGADTSAAGQCTSDAAHNTGLYYNSNCDKNPANVCCSTSSVGTCISYSNATCCSSGQTCQNGQCVQTTYKYVCTCGDFTQRSTCNALPCGPDTFATVCESVCADTGAVLGVQCNGTC